MKEVVVKNRFGTRWAPWFHRFLEQNENHMEILAESGAELRRVENYYETGITVLSFKDEKDYSWFMLKYHDS